MISSKSSQCFRKCLVVVLLTQLRNAWESLVHKPWLAPPSPLTVRSPAERLPLRKALMVRFKSFPNMFYFFNRKKKRSWPRHQQWRLHQVWESKATLAGVLWKCFRKSCLDPVIAVFGTGCVPESSVCKLLPQWGRDYLHDHRKLFIVYIGSYVIATTVHSSGGLRHSFFSFSQYSAIARYFYNRLDSTFRRRAFHALFRLISKTIVKFLRWNFVFYACFWTRGNGATFRIAFFK